MRLLIRLLVKFIRRMYVKHLKTVVRKHTMMSLAVALFFILIAGMLLVGCAARQGTDTGTGSSPPTSALSEPDPALSEPDPTLSGNTGSDSIDTGDDETPGAAILLYQGHGSIRITTAEGKVIYVDPYAGEGYDLSADLILITHQHSDHNKVDLITSKNPGCETITDRKALAGGTHQVFEFDYVVVEAVEAYNENHNPYACVGYILTFADGVQLYASGDTSTTTQMETFAARNLDYALLCCDGTYNMDVQEASECAALIGARHSIPYHTTLGALFNRERAEKFEAEGRIIVDAGEEIILTGQ